MLLVVRGAVLQGILGGAVLEGGGGVSYRIAAETDPVWQLELFL